MTDVKPLTAEEEVDFRDAACNEGRRHVPDVVLRLLATLDAERAARRDLEEAREALRMLVPHWGTSIVAGAVDALTAHILSALSAAKTSEPAQTGDGQQRRQDTAPQRASEDCGISFGRDASTRRWCEPLSAAQSPAPTGDESDALKLAREVLEFGSVRDAAWTLAREVVRLHESKSPAPDGDERRWWIADTAPSEHAYATWTCRDRLEDFSEWVRPQAIEVVPAARAEAAERQMHADHQLTELAVRERTDAMRRAESAEQRVRELEAELAESRKVSESRWIEAREMAAADMRERAASECEVMAATEGSRFAKAAARIRALPLRPSPPADDARKGER